jgi:hypothetical protein
MMNAPFPDLRREHRAKPVQSEPYCLMANIDATLEQQIFYLSQRQWIADVHHHRETDRRRRTVETAEEIAHRRKLQNTTPGSNQFAQTTPKRGL